ncbi:DUF6801 domain-containing protein [Actinomadura viridis]|uniref:DUF6801 domain-containing protein n=1 Tax=Actinomadura viridis TaxID=58110 RepID=UPI0036A4168E
MSGRGRWGPGRLARTAAIASVVLVAGLIPGAGVALGDTQRADVGIGYTCRLPSAPAPVDVRVKALFPATGKIGTPARTDDVALTVTIPRESLGDLTKDDAVSVAGTARLQTLWTQAEQPLSVEWPGLTVPEKKLPQDGALVLKASGQVPTTAVTKAGDLVVSAGELTFRLQTRNAGGAVTSPGGLSFSCVPDLGQDTTLVTVPVTGPEQAPVTTSPGGGEAPARTGPRVRNDDVCPPMPEPKLNPKFPVPEPPPGVDPSPIAPDYSCAWVEGHANVNKLKGASALKGKASVIIGLDQFFKAETPPEDPHGYTQARTIALSYLNSTQSTFLTFGFMPTTATMEITQIGTANAIAIGPAAVASPRPTITTVTAEASIRLRDVKVNGTPMDVGPNCKTARPVRLTLTGDNTADPSYEVALGGRLSGTADVPAFSGCGVDDDLDRLLTASVSGKGNYVRLTQGPVCYIVQQDPNLYPCPPEVFGYTITPGGDFRFTSGEIVFRAGLGSTRTIKCASSEVRGTFKRGSGIDPRSLGTAAALSFNDCVGEGSLASLGDVTVRAVAPLRLGHNMTAGLDKTTGIMNLQVSTPHLEFSGGGCQFKAVGAGGSPTYRFGMQYPNGSSSLTVPSGGTGTVAEPTGCPSTLRGSFGILNPVPFTVDSPQLFKYGGTPK